MIFSLASDIGKVRKNNEDFIDSQIIYKDDDTKIGIFALADGMGGHNKGEVVFQRMSKEDFSFRYAPGPCKTNVIRAHDFKHFTAYQSHD